MDEKAAESLLNEATAPFVPVRLHDKEGYHPAPQWLGDTFEQRFARFTAAGSLSAMAEEYVYFTHGLLFTHGYWSFDPITDHIVETKGLCEPFGINLPMPAFKWFDGKDPKTGEVVDARWNSQICAVSRDRWPGLRSFLLEIGGRNSITKTYNTLMLQQIPIVDTVALAKMSALPEKLPMVMCNCFALSTNRRLVCFAPELRKMLWEPIPIMIRNPDTRVVKYAKALFAEVATPLAGTFEPTRKEAEVSLAEGVLLDMRLKPSEVPKNDV